MVARGERFADVAPRERGAAEAVQKQDRGRRRLAPLKVAQPKPLTVVNDSFIASLLPLCAEAFCMPSVPSLDVAHLTRPRHAFCAYAWTCLK